MTRAGKLTLSTAPLSIIIPRCHWHQTLGTAAAAAQEICRPGSNWQKAQKPSAEVSQSNTQMGQNLRHHPRAVSPRAFVLLFPHSVILPTSSSQDCPSSTEVADRDSSQTRPVGRAARSVASVTVLVPSATDARPRVFTVRATLPGSSSVSSPLRTPGLSSVQPRTRTRLCFRSRVPATKS